MAKYNPKKDPLMRAATKVRYGGSSKTRVHHLRETSRFVETLRDLGYKVEKWNNVTNKHMGAVVDKWQEDGLADKTIKEYLSGVRATAGFYGNDRIHKENTAFGIGRIQAVTNIDKSMSDDRFREISNNLRSGNDHDRRVEAVVQLCRYLGCRHEEARKFSPSRDVLPDGRIHLAAGTKGGKERVLSDISPEGRQAIENARKIAGKGSLIPPGMTDKQWKRTAYSILTKAGATGRNEKFHACRHAYAQERYEKLTGFPCRVKFDSKEDFEQSARDAVGDKWKDFDLSARGVIKVEMGHGVQRDDVVSQYLGSNSK